MSVVTISLPVISCVVYETTARLRLPVFGMYSANNTKLTQGLCISMGLQHNAPAPDSNIQIRYSI